MAKSTTNWTRVTLLVVAGLAAGVVVTELNRPKPKKKAPVDPHAPPGPLPPDGLGSPSEPWKTKQGWRREREYLRLLGYRIAINDEPMTSWTDRMWVALYQKDFNKMVDWGFTGADRLTVDGGYGAKTMATIWIAKDIQDSEKSLFWNFARGIH